MNLNILYSYIFWGMASCFLSACKSNFIIVYPYAETTPVANKNDAADDIAIFIHPTDEKKHLIIGTDKQQGLHVYDHAGRLVNSLPVGRINNVDLRQDVRFDEELITLVGGSNRTDNTLVFFALDENDLSLRQIEELTVSSAVDEVYGFCLYKGEKVYAFVVGKDGVVEQWELLGGEEIGFQKVRQFDVGGQCEGLVADDETGFLFVGEEEVGIWKYLVDPKMDASKSLIQAIKDNPMLRADIEGLALYRKEEGEGFLIASSQGNNSYALYDRKAPHYYQGSFKIYSHEAIDGTNDTDGIEATSLPFGLAHPRGIFVVQDGQNKGGNQNFKLVDWLQISSKMGLE